MPDSCAGKFTLLDVEKAKSCPAWPGWCDGAPELAEGCGLSGLSKEEAGTWLLSEGSLMELWQRKWATAMRISVSKPPNYMNEIFNELKRREPLRNEILEYVKGTLDAGVVSPVLPMERSCW
jgi:hypothetical protein